MPPGRVYIDREHLSGGVRHGRERSSIDPQLGSPRRTAEAAGTSDAELLGRFVADRDEAAFELLLWRHARLVYEVCLRVLHDPHDAEDAFQATFLALARRAGRIAKREAVAGWLHKVAYRVAAWTASRRRPGGTPAKSSPMRSKTSAVPPGVRKLPRRKSGIAGHSRSGDRPASGTLPGGRDLLLPRRQVGGRGGRAARLPPRHRGQPTGAGAEALASPPRRPRPRRAGRAGTACQPGERRSAPFRLIPTL